MNIGNRMSSILFAAGALLSMVALTGLMATAQGGKRITNVFNAASNAITDSAPAAKSPRPAAPAALDVLNLNSQRGKLCFVHLNGPNPEVNSKDGILKGASDKWVVVVEKHEDEKLNLTSDIWIPVASINYIEFAYEPASAKTKTR